MSYVQFHWRAYNLLRRLLGVAALAVCLAFLWSAVSLWLGLRDAQPGERTAVGYLYLAAALLTLVLGAILLRLRPYRPDQGDISWWAGRAGGYSHESRAFKSELRSWWTGEYRREPSYSRLPRQASAEQTDERSSRAE